MMKTLILTLTGAIVLTGCAQTNSQNITPVSSETYQEITFTSTKATPAERAKCEAVGGIVRPAGKLQADHCIQNLPDAGKACSDASDCLGRCILTDDSTVKPGDAITGVCEATDEVFGCTALVSNGTYEGTLCID